MTFSDYFLLTIRLIILIGFQSLEFQKIYRDNPSDVLSMLSGTLKFNGHERFHLVFKLGHILTWKSKIV